MLASLGSLLRQHGGVLPSPALLIQREARAIDDGDDDDSVCSDGDGTFSGTHKTYFKLIKMKMNSKGTLNRALISH